MNILHAYQQSLITLSILVFALIIVIMPVSKGIFEMIDIEIELCESVEGDFEESELLDDLKLEFLEVSTLFLLNSIRISEATSIQLDQHGAFKNFIPDVPIPPPKFISFS